MCSNVWEHYYKAIRRKKRKREEKKKNVLSGCSYHEEGESRFPQAYKHANSMRWERETCCGRKCVERCCNINGVVLFNARDVILTSMKIKCA
mmetsp:Transcript_3750/g.6637  ORF Transcript_3750/g.6637 Transcript_3750/m.6637 type:complete len:92 (+) Transcript_3750:3014-3289(+)